MEESYAVHRRRKAAASARRREKTPEPSRQLLDEEVRKDEDDEAKEARARMERMVEDTERMEALVNKEPMKAVDQTEDKGLVEEKQVVQISQQEIVTLRTQNEENSLDDNTSKVTEIVVSENRTESVRRVRDTARRRAKRSQERLSSGGSSADDDKSSKSEAERCERKREKKPRRLRKESSRRNDSNDVTRSSKHSRNDEPIAPPRLKSHGETKSETTSSYTRQPHSDDVTKIRSGKTISEETIRSRSRRSSCSEEGHRSRKSSRSEDVIDAEANKVLHHDESLHCGDDGPLPRAAKQIIPLSNESLIHDLEIAQQQYDKREIGILDPDVEDYVSPKMEAALRKRKRHKSKIEVKDIPSDKDVTESDKTSWLWSWLKVFKFRKTKEKVDDDVKVTEPVKVKQADKKPEVERKSRVLEYWRVSRDIRAEFRIYLSQNPRETDILRIHRNRCIAELILMIIYCGLGAFIFRFTEGAFEQFYKCGVKRVKRDFLDNLWNYSHNLREDDWKSMARRKLKEFEEQLYEAYDAGLHTYSGQKTWSFLNAFVYCLTVITTIGYGHIYPTTSTGQAMTIIYAIFGIPMFLIILADFGKLFTRGMKFLWAFVRRVYYTGSCRRVRRTAPVQEVMKGVQLVYDFATFRRPSQMNPEEIEEMNRQAPQTILNLDGNTPLPQPDTPGTPALSAFAIDDEFNLPISVAITLLLAYIFVGATVYHIWEDWNFFQSFYFVFISMSTIGFGDFVPKHPIYMMCSIVYLVFGLALTSMCINVVQVMLSDSFKQASQKIGATIGFEVSVEDGSIQTTAPPPVEVADVHATIKEDDEYKEDKQAPRAKEEDVDL